jgi:hypothetical protein
LPNVLQAQDIAPFKLMDVSGRLDVRYHSHNSRNDSLTGSTFTETPIWQELLTIRTRSYVYHPAFLTIDIGGGPTMVQSEFKSDSRSSSSEQTVFNFDAMLSFFSRRPTPFNLRYSRNFPQTSTGLSGSFVTKRENYGVHGLYRPLGSRLFLRWEFARSDADGSGSGAVVDDVNDSFRVSGLLPYSENRDLNFNLYREDSMSKSGNLGLDIQESRITTTGLDLSASDSFGDGAKVNLRQNLNWSRQTTILDNKTQQDRLNYLANFNWDHTSATNYFGNFRFVDLERTGSWSRSSRISAGMTHRLPANLFTRSSGQFSRSSSRGYSTDAKALDMSVSYRKALPFGKLSASFRIGARQTDQDSTTDSVTVFDESIDLTGTDAISLSSEFVVQQSVIVTNQSKTQTYVEGQDYRLFEIGGTTNIERLVNGNIEEGQTVLITYDFLSSGTVKYESLRENVSVNLKTLKYVNLYMAYSNVNNEISSGRAVTPISDSTDFETGVHVDFPLGRWSLAANYRFIEHESDISSSVTNVFDVSAAVSLLKSMRLSTSLFSAHVDNVESLEDTNRSGISVSINSRLRGGWYLTYSGRYSEDDGGSLFREELRHSLQLNWAYRLVRFSLSASDSNVKQGGNDQNYTTVNARLSRYFR